MEALLKSLIMDAFYEGREAERNKGYWGDGENHGFVCTRVADMAWNGHNLPTPYSDDDSLTCLYDSIRRIKERLT